MKRFVLLLFIVFSLQNAIAQEYEIIRHEVQLGETVRMISRKYKVEPAEIYRLNKFAVDGISQGMILQLPVARKETPIESDPPVAERTESTSGSQDTDDGATTTTTKTVTTTTVKKKKTTADTQAGTDETQPAETARVETSSGDLGGTGSAFTHTVAKGETLFSIARKYNVPVDAIKSQNDMVLKRGLQPGQVLAIIKPAGGGTEPDLRAEPAENATPAQSVTTVSTSQTEIKHKVQKGETLFSLSKKYNVPVDEIKMQNEALLKKGLQVGQVLTIRTNN